MEHVQMSEVPDLENAIFIGAFAGWNDAASAATWAVKFLINQWEATPFAEIEPEVFYDFTASRPRVRISGGSLRRLSWPANRFYVHRSQRGERQAPQRDIVLLLGEEPQLQWTTFSREVLDICRQCHVEDVVMLGSLVAEVPHTAPVQISGTTSKPALLRKMSLAGIERATYEGASGIPTVIQDVARKEGLATASLWGAAPHYVSATPNLPVSEALLEKLDALYDFHLHLNDLSRAARRFTQRVSSLVAEDPDVSAYVRELERRSEGGAKEPGDLPSISDASGIHRIPMGGELPSPEQAIQEVEDLLRQFREDSDHDE